MDKVQASGFLVLILYNPWVFGIVCIPEWKKMCSRLRDTASWIPLAVEASSLNLGSTFSTICGTGTNIIFTWVRSRNLWQRNWSVYRLLLVDTQVPGLDAIFDRRELGKIGRGDIASSLFKSWVSKYQPLPEVPPIYSVIYPWNVRPIYSGSNDD